MNILDKIIEKKKIEVAKAKELISVEQLKQNKLIDYLGKISYGIYMYHLAVGNLLLGVTTAISPAFWFLKPLVILVGTAFVAAVSYEFFEKRIMERV